MSHKIVQTQLAADLVGGGSITVAYPSGTSKGNFSGSLQHRLVYGSNPFSGGNVFTSPAYFTLTFNATNITINWTSGSPTIPNGSTVWLHLDEPGYSASRNKDPFPQDFIGNRFGLFSVNFGSPAALAATGICAAQAISGSNVSASINGTLASGGAVTVDYDRSVSVVSSGAGDTTQTVTVRGKDRYGVSMAETLTLNGTTTVNGLKAFKTITSVTVSATMAGNLSVGVGNKFGIPYFLQSGAYRVLEIVNGAAVTTGTLVAGATAKPTATTGDVRGTYAPSTAPDGSNTYELVLALGDPDFLGQTQFS